MTSIQAKSRTTNINEIPSGSFTCEFDEKIERVATAALNCLRSGSVYPRQLLTKLTGSQRLAESILEGSFSGLVLGIVFIVLGIPINNFALNCISGYLFRENFRLFQNPP